MSLLSQLAALAEAKQIRAIDYQLARFIEKQGGCDIATMAACLTSFELASGNVCLDLSALQQRFSQENKEAQQPLWQCVAELCTASGIHPAQWPAHLADSPMFAQGAPLKLYGDRIYLSRYFDFEHQVAEVLGELSQPLAIQPDSLSSSLERLFAGQTTEPNWQKIAAAVAATRRFAVISGGPGTGKTTTVTKLLAVLCQQSEHPPQIKLAAPTGKAAARLTESITGAKQSLGLDPALASQIPEQASTLHRLLGTLPGTHSFRHNRRNPLHLDVLVVDEASMVDLPMMARLLDALPPHARLILLGDRDQLASVEAGSVLGDICAFAEQGYSPEQAGTLEKLTGHELAEFTKTEGSPLRDGLCLLRKSYRFDANSGIGVLARAVNQGDVRAASVVFKQDFSDIRRFTLNDESYQSLIKDTVAGYRDYLQQIKPLETPEQARPILEAFNRFQALVALRNGPYGVSGLNQEIEQALSQHRLIALPQDTSRWYAGRPVLITSNDHGLKLYNGDIGITLPDSQGRLRVYVEQSDGQIRALLPSRLPSHETVYAMTVHKSQGSEFTNVALVLPDTMSPVVTRELVYTGITRARKTLDLYAEPRILAQAISQRTQRASGLAARLAAAKQN